MRLEPIDKPRNIFVRLAFWLSRRRLGKVMAPLRTIYARFPRLLMASRGMLGMLEDDRVMAPRMRNLLSTWVSTLNGCAFCRDLHEADAVGHGDYADLAHLPSFRTHGAFSASERAALAYAEEATLYSKVEDETFAELKRHFDDDAIVRIAWFVATMNYFNKMASPLGLASDGFCQIALDKAGRGEPVAKQVA